MESANGAETPDGRRLSDRQVANRDAVLVAAVDAFATRGYAATSIDDIADRLGATKGRIYHYFRTKGEIFVGIHRRAMEMVIAAAQEARDEQTTPTAQLWAMAHAHALLMMNEAGFMRLAVHHTEMTLAQGGRTRQDEIDEVFAMRKAYEAMFEKVIAAGIEAGEFNQADSRLTARAVLGSINWMSVWYNPRGNSDATQRDEIADYMAEFVTRGVGVKPSRARARKKPSSLAPRATAETTPQRAR